MKINQYFIIHTIIIPNSIDKGQLAEINLKIFLRIKDFGNLELLLHSKKGFLPRSRRVSSTRSCPNPSNKPCTWPTTNI